MVMLSHIREEALSCRYLLRVAVHISLVLGTEYHKAPPRVTMFMVALPLPAACNPLSPRPLSPTQQQVLQVLARHLSILAPLIILQDLLWEA